MLCWGGTRIGNGRWLRRSVWDGHKTSPILSVSALGKVTQRRL